MSMNTSSSSRSTSAEGSAANVAATSAPGWARKWLIAAGIYNLVWGAAVVLFPSLLFDFASMEQPLYPQIWQCVGMIVGVYGIGYLAAARDPLRHWPIVLVGLLGKIFGPIGFAQAVLTGALPVAFGATILTNDLIWWIPFAMILWLAARAHGNYDSGEAVPLDDALDGLRDQRGASLRELSTGKPLLLLLTRHTGCTFCKEAIADLKQHRSAIEAEGLSIAVVSMSEPDDLAYHAEQFGLSELSWISDPDRLSYRALELKRGSFMELFGPSVWLRGIAATLRGHLVGKLAGDGFQMPGSFVIKDGRVLRAHRHKNAGERVDHASFVCELPA